VCHLAATMFGVACSYVIVKDLPAAGRQSSALCNAGALLLAQLVPINRKRSLETTLATARLYRVVSA